MQATQEELWMDLFQVPHNWSDHRQEKEAGSKSPKFPDFKRKSDGECVGLGGPHVGREGVGCLGRVGWGWGRGVVASCSCVLVAGQVAGW